MGKNGRLLLRAFGTIAGVVLTSCIFVLFILWYPDFIVWYEIKMANSALSHMIFAGIIPLYIMVAGVTGLVFLLFLSLVHFIEPEAKTAKGV